MVSARFAILMAAIFAVSALLPAADALTAPTIQTPLGPLPAEDQGAAGTPSVDDPLKTFTPYELPPPGTNGVPQITGGFQQDGQHMTGPYGDLLHQLASVEEVTPALLAGMAAEYYASLGFDTPGAQIRFEENASISYSHSLGDINDDGLTDILLDQYCVDTASCIPRFSVLQNPRSALDQYCFWPHSFLAVSGKDGENIWNLSRRDFNVMLGPLNGCVNEFIIGTIPDGDTFDVLVYQYTYDNAIILTLTGAPITIDLRHRIALLDGKTGAVVWQKSFTGYYRQGGAAGQAYFTARNLFVHPLVQTIREEGVQYLPTTNTPGVTLQGVGFNFTVSNTIPPPWGTRAYVLINSYQPDEWAMGVEPLTGKVLWNRDTFQPTAPQSPTGQRAPVGDKRSQFPVLIAPPVPHTLCLYDATACGGRPFNWGIAPGRLSTHYWNFRPCCYDLNGDTVPDLVYTVREWGANPSTNQEGPYGIEGSIVAIDGKTGDRLYRHVIEKGTPFAYGQAVQHLGDVDHDGIADYFVHQIYFTWDYVHRVSVRSGKTGEQIWSLNIPRELQILPIGDADKDGSVDLVFLDFTFEIGAATTFGFGAGTAFSRANVTHTPIKVRSGATGDVIWEYKSFEAPSDVFAVYQSFIVNGLPDFNNDGVGDLISDDPLFLPDLTTVHRYTYLSGADGKVLFKMVSAGLFAFPALLGDVTADGRDDILLISGDINDLWGTVYSGNGTAAYSRRVLTTRTSNYLTANPLIRTHHISNNGTESQDFFLNFQLRVVNVVRVFGPLVGILSTKPQLMKFTGWNGTVDWSIPSMWDQNFTVLIQGRTPATELYATALLYESGEDRVPAAPLATPIQIAAGVTTLGSAFAVSFFFGLRRWKL